MRWLSDETVDHLRDIAELPDFEGTRYRLEREIGRGGMGIVYLAEDTTLQRQVAIKVLQTALLSPDMVRRILREGTVIAQLEHPAIVPVHDAGTLPDGRVFYVMKFVRGESLTQRIDSIDSIKDRLRIFLRACEAVAFAHARNVIHRDLKPDNIMLGPFGEVLVMDWGTAKIKCSKEAVGDSKSADSLTEGTTAHGLIIGTTGFMSPEQAAGANQVDERSDVYSLGAVLHFLLQSTGSSELSTLIAGSSVPESPSDTKRLFHQKTPKPLKAICLKALAMNLGDRYLSVEALAADVSRFLDGESVSAYQESFFEKADRWISRHRFLILLVLAYLLMRVILLLASGR